jgi:predicted house-cleaning noncanonical NTP pyrophosphatase (MazG superfamily)
MGYKSDHGFRTDLWTQVTSGLPDDLKRKAHEHLGKYYREEKDEMEYNDLLEVVKEVMSDYSDWSWNGQRWHQ